METSISQVLTLKNELSGNRPIRGRLASFTLLELVVTLSIASVLAAICFVHTSGYFRAAMRTRVVDRIMDADRQARLLSQRRGQIETVMEFQKGRGFIRSEFPAETDSRSFELPSQVKLNVQTENGEQQIPFFSNGSSPTYLIEIRLPDSVEWLAVLGISGQSIRISDRDQAEAILTLSRRN